MKVTLFFQLVLLIHKFFLNFVEKVNIFNDFFMIVPFYRHLKQLTALSTYD